MHEETDVRPSVVDRRRNYRENIPHRDSPVAPFKQTPYDARFFCLWIASLQLGAKLPRLKGRKHHGHLIGRPPVAGRGRPTIETPTLPDNRLNSVFSSPIPHPATPNAPDGHSGHGWAYTVPYPVHYAAQIDKLIQCESQGVNIARPDSNHKISWGVLQFSGTSTWEEAEARFKFQGKPDDPRRCDPHGRHDD
jgi:hypothetical protein